MSPESSAIWQTRGVANSSRIGRQLVLDHPAQQRVVGEDRLELADRRPDVLELGLEIDPRQPGELAQLHVEDVDGLQLGELERLGHQSGLGRRGVVAAADQGDDLVDDVERLDPAFEDVLAPARPVEAELRPPGDHVDLVGDVAVRAPGRG